MGKNYLIFSDSKSGYDNLALDEWLLDNVREDELILYFYVNENAVIIGKNQNPLKECDLEKMEKDGVELVRRITGGGAVYHDEGNLNFSFIAGKQRFDKDRQHRFILETVKSLSIPCEFSGRNDLLSEGRKFSGNAYCSRGVGKQHHGTLLVSSDLTKLQNYLTVDPRKIKAKGVDSVRSRVCNLSDINPLVSVESLKKVIPEKFREVFGEYEIKSLSEDDKKEIGKYRTKHSSDEWLFGETPEFNAKIDTRLPFGCIEILMNVKEWKIDSCTVFTDANDFSLPDRIKASLSGIPYNKKSICSALLGEGGDDCKALAEYIASDECII